MTRSSPPPSALELLGRIRSLVEAAADLELPHAPVVVIVAPGRPLPDGLEALAYEERAGERAAVGRCSRERAAELAAFLSAGAGADVRSADVRPGRVLVVALGASGVVVSTVAARRGDPAPGALLPS